MTTSPAGGSFASAFAGYRFFQAYGRLEWKLNNLNPDEESRLLGLAYGAVALPGPQPEAGDAISVTLAGNGLGAPQTVSATAAAGVPGQDMRLALLADLVAAIAANSLLSAAGFLAVAPFGSGPFSENQVPWPEIAFTAPAAFTLSAAASGVAYPQITATGALLPPTSSIDGETTLWGYLPILDGLESAFGSASQNLDTIQASVWKGRSNEIGQRLSLYKNWQGMLSDFLGVPVNPDRTARPGQYGAMRFA